MTQTVPAALVAPSKPSLTVGYLIRALNGTVATAFTTTNVTEQGTATGYYRVTGGVAAPDAGGTLEWYVNNAGSAGAFLSAVAIEAMPDNFTAMAITEGGAVTAGTVSDKTGYSLTQTFPTNFASLAITASTGQVTVGTLANNAITAAAIATDAIDAEAIAASAVTEIQAGLATQASVNSIPTTPLLAANYTAPDNSGIAAIKAKTDALPSDPADQSLLIDAINTRASQISVNAIPTTTAPTAAQVATAVEAALLLDSDGQALLTAIREAVATLFDSGADVSVITLVDAIAAKITADHGAGSYLTPNLSALALEATAQAIKAKTDTISGQGLTQAEKDKLNELWQRAGLDLFNPVTRVQTGAVVTETFGAVEIEISNTTPNTVTSTRQPND